MSSFPYYINLAYSGGGGTDQVRRITYLHEEGLHERAVVLIDSETPDAKRFATGTPVRVSWGLPPIRVTSFPGYVSHVEPTYEPDSPGKFFNVVVVGASFYMKEGGFATHHNKTVSQVAREIAETYRFDTTFVQDHARLWPLLAQQGRSDWAFLADLAAKAGYVVYCQGVNLFFHDRVESLTKLRGNVPTVMPVDSTPGFLGTLLSFKSLTGHTAPAGGDLAQRQMHGLDPRSLQTITVQNSADEGLIRREGLTPLFTEGVTSEVINDPGEAASSLQAGAYGNRLYIQAELKMRGDVRVQVGNGVFINGLNAVDNGLWYVRKVRHTCTLNSYTVDATVGRDVIGFSTDLAAAATASPLREARLNTGQWVAA